VTVGYIHRPAVTAEVGVDNRRPLTMTFAYDYPLLGLFWTFVWAYLLIAWLFLVFHVMIDVLRRPDLRGIAKAAWLAFIVIVPFLGVLGYLATSKGEVGSFRDRPGMAEDYQARAI
jgi:quinol-cytochrome oxidoreductase complex cytochrome b subunit